MLKTYRARAAFAAAFLTCAAGPAVSENFDILMMENAFFPEVTFVQPGDTITFVNMSGLPRNIAATDKSWDTENIMDGGSLTVTVSSEMSSEFKLSVKGAANDDSGTAVGHGEEGALTDDNLTLSGDEAATAESAAAVVIGKLDFTAPTIVAAD